VKHIKTQQYLKQARKCIDIGQCAKAEKLCNKILQSFPDHPDAKLILAESFFFTQQFDRAIPVLQAILSQQPEHPDARIFLFGCYKDSNQFKPLLTMANQFRDHPLTPVETLSAFRAYQDLCNWDESNKLCKQVILDLKQGNIPLRYMAASLLNLNTMPEISAADLFAIHQQWGKQTKQACADANLQLPLPKQPRKRIKIAYLSVDFNKHPVGHFALPVIQNHNRDLFEVFCYARLLKDDDMTTQFRTAADHFIDITNLSYAETAVQIAQAGIHILIDLSGHTAHSPLGIMAFKPAPVQIT